MFTIDAIAVIVKQHFATVFALINIGIHGGSVRNVVVVIKSVSVGSEFRRKSLARRIVAGLNNSFLDLVVEITRELCPLN